MKLYSTRDAAKELGISVQRVKQLRDAYKVGQVIGRTLIFTEDDLAVLRNRDKSTGPKRPRTKEMAPGTH